MRGKAAAPATLPNALVKTATAAVHRRVHSISAQEATTEASLLETHGQFLAVLKLASASPLSWLSILPASSRLTPKLFLKHLMVLTDATIAEVNELLPLAKYFETGVLNFEWRDKTDSYTFRALAQRDKVTVYHLGICYDSLITKDQTVPDALVDIVMVLMFGGLSTAAILPASVHQRFRVGAILGDPWKVDEAAKARYIGRTFCV